HGELPRQLHHHLRHPDPAPVERGRLHLHHHGGRGRPDRRGGGRLGRRPLYAPAADRVAVRGPAPDHGPHVPGRGRHANPRGPVGGHGGVLVRQWTLVHQHPRVHHRAHARRHPRPLH